MRNWRGRQACGVPPIAPDVCTVIEDVIGGDPNVTVDLSDSFVWDGVTIPPLEIFDPDRAEWVSPMTAAQLSPTSFVCTYDFMPNDGEEWRLMSTGASPVFCVPQTGTVVV